jgi:hypothetical protein
LSGYIEMGSKNQGTQVQSGKDIISQRLSNDYAESRFNIAQIASPPTDP